MDKIELALESILSSWEQGRKVLVIYGAGVSSSANIPSMRGIFSHLLAKLASNNYQQELITKRLRPWLNALASNNAPRSLAAMTLGTFQKAHTLSGNSEGVYKELERIWNEFSEDFVAGRIPPSQKSINTNDDCDDTIRTAQEFIYGHSFGGVISI